MDADFCWLEPWYPVDDASERAGVEAQLTATLTPRHVLFGEPVTLIGRRGDTDDALFLLADGRVAEVHLTWSEQSEMDPNWPWTAMFASLEAWARESMAAAYRDWTD